MRARYERKIAEKEVEFARRESALGAQRAELTKAVDSLEQQVAGQTQSGARADGEGGGQ
jgi:hypothetical protein